MPMIDQYSTSSSSLRTPPRSSSHQRRSLLLSSPTSFVRTPTSKTPSRRRNQHTPSLVKARMSPSPSLIRTPMSSRRNPTPSSYSAGDRFIPSRRGMNVELCRRTLLSTTDADNSKNPSTVNSPSSETTSLRKEYQRRMLSSLLHCPLDALDENAQPKGLLSFGGGTPQQEFRSMFATAGGRRLEDPYALDTLRVLQKFEKADKPVVVAPRPNATLNRKIPDRPFRILDAPNLVDNFYLNLMSWSQDNILAVALGCFVYLMNSAGEVQPLATILGDGNYVTSVSWCSMPGHSKYLAIGTNLHTVQVWDSEAMYHVRTLHGHSGRVSSMDWNPHWLTTGGRDSLILQHDVRAAGHVVSTYKAHEQEVCGLKWNDEGTTLASGGNDDSICIWDAAMSASRGATRDGMASNEVAPRLLMTEHNAAVKALDWCPLDRGLLASGGGTSDRTIKLWNSNSGAMLHSIDTGSQVCSVLWSKHQPELCSAHGFAEHRNVQGVDSGSQLMLWKYNGRGSGSLTKVKALAGHQSRILGLACSPDGSTVVSASGGDESLRFWNIFGSPPPISRQVSLTYSPTGDVSFGMPAIR